MANILNGCRQRLLLTIFCTFVLGVFFGYLMNSNLRHKVDYTKIKVGTFHPVLSEILTRHPLQPPYPYPYKFLIKLQDKCSVRKPFLVILVPSRCYDTASRNIIRETWGNELNYHSVDVVTLFLIGISPTQCEPEENLLKDESDFYRDIIQQDFLDTYYNLTLKTLMGVEWVAKFCSIASYVVKIDTDMFLNVEYLIHELLRPDLPVRTNYYTGQLISNVGPVREKDDKWYVPEEIYPNKIYPPYCSGSGYVFSTDLAKKIYDVAQVIKIIPMEDVFMGIVLKELNVSPEKAPGNLFNRYDKYNRCTFHKLITAHIDGEDLQEIWRNFWTNKTLGC
ncbi:beta-1,3-galactosyltransferase 2-like [Pelobates fuscus]|uniref:beta-1,3-galactosyltransferase 2-like n=1 Tax=Pelobates fuscus TaxID=191477 RepID=UPI002FE4B1E2